MGVMRFIVHPDAMLGEWPEVHRAYLSAVDQTVWPTRVEFKEGILTCRRHCSDSGKLHVGWPVPSLGRPVLTTASLPEREQPYILVVELARGKIVQVRNQAALWQAAGMVLPAEYASTMRDAHSLFGRAASSQDVLAECSEVAQRALGRACDAADVLMRAYTRQRLEARHRQYPNLPTALGCGLGDSIPVDGWKKPFTAAFNCAVVPIEWRSVEPYESDYRWEAYDAQIDWCQSQGLMINGGPLIDLSTRGLPDWLSQWSHDYWNLQSFIKDFVETAVARYSSRIRLWEVAARGNSGGALQLTEENRLTLVAAILETARKADEEAQLVVRIDQPWGEYLARGQHKLSPLQFADALIRAGLGVSALNLEVAVGYSPRSSPLRDMLDFSRMIDLWSTLGLPLQVTLALPSAQTPDLEITTDLEVQPGAWKTSYSEEAQTEWVENYLPLLLAKPSVVAVFWSHFADGQPHRFPHAGLMRPDGTLKPAIERFAAYRKAYWK